MRRFMLLIIFAAILGVPVVASAQAPPASDSPPLRPHSESDQDALVPRPGGLSSPMTLVGSLVLVVGVFLLVVWVLRRASPAGSGALPVEVFEPLGRAPLVNRQQAMMLRFGNKLLLVAFSATDARTLAEITDPTEVDRLLDVCRRPHAATSAIRHVLGHKEEQDE